jgi:hypothetical protein
MSPPELLEVGIVFGIGRGRISLVVNRPDSIQREKLLLSRDYLAPRRLLTYMLTCA